MRRLLLLVWRLSNYVIGFVGFLVFMESSRKDILIDDNYSEWVGDGERWAGNMGWAEWGFAIIGIGIIALAAFSAVKNAEFRSK